jgi:hypothetical protein
MRQNNINSTSGKRWSSSTDRPHFHEDNCQSSVLVANARGAKELADGFSDDKYSVMAMVWQVG